MKTTQKIRYKLIELLVGKTPTVFNTDITKDGLQVRGFGFYKNVRLG